MALEGKGTIYKHKSGGIRAYIPTVVGEDSGFPFEEGEKVKVTIRDNSLVFTRCVKGEKRD